MSKRAQGEGSIYQRSDGRWAASLTVGWNGQKQKRKAFYGSTQKEVQEKLTAARAALQQGYDVAPDRLTIESWLKQWLKNEEPPAVKPKTYTAYEYQVRCHLIPALGKKPVSKLRPQDVREFLRTKLAVGLSPKTVRHLRATLRAALNVAVQDGIIVRNAAALAKLPRFDASEKAELQVFSQQQALHFLDAVRGHRLEALFTVAIALGMREGEILGLRWADVDFGAGSLQIRSALQRIKLPGEEKSSLQLIEPKTKKSRRTISLPAIAISALHGHRTRQDQERTLCGSQWKDGAFVFTTSVGTPLDQKKLFLQFRAVLKKAELPLMRFHDLRHSAATLLLVQGVHPRCVMELLGHSSITLTMNTYSHVLNELKRATATTMEAILNPVAVSVAVKQAGRTVN